jgi:group I intron endonuclease
MIVYKITNLFYGTSYIGKTIKTLDQRWLEHLKEALGGGSRILCRAIRKYGPDAFSREIICECTDHTDLNEMEKFCIAVFHTRSPLGYNMTDGGDGVVGLVFTKEHREKLRQASLGNKYNDGFKNFLGHTHSEESRKKIGEAGRGRECRPETRDKLRAIHKGRVFSKESRQRMSEAMRGNKNGRFTKGVPKSKPVWNTGKPLTEEHRQKLKEAWKRRKARKK